MKIEINKESVIDHNKHILEVSGGTYAIINSSNLEFAVDSVNNETNPINQAANFLYYAGMGHPFEAGNKRTAFKVAEGILLSGSRLINASQDEIVNFVTGSVAQGKASREDVRVWLDSHSESTGESPDFNQATSEAISKDVELLKKLD